jgi:hypothetical protein
LHNVFIQISPNLFTGKIYAQSEPAISISPAPAMAIQGDRANGLTQRNAWL